MKKIKRALLSVSDKAGIVELARELHVMGVELLSTGGTAKAIRDGGVPVKDVSEHTGFPEMMDGRLKTLHPKVHGGLLGRRDNPSDVAEMKANGIEPIDLVVVNLYPFEATVAREGVTFDEAIENIDIGGPTMLRSSAKNFLDVTVIVDPADYDMVLREMKSNDGETKPRTRQRLARKVFMHTCRYDTLIADYLTAQAPREDVEEFPPTVTMSFKRASSLRYGENPHQHAAAYMEDTPGLSIFNARKHQGKEMSFNNYYDANSAIMLVKEFGAPACAIIKHNNPCGVAVAGTPAEAYAQALETDPISAYGGVVAFNCVVDGDTAAQIEKMFVEVVVAPGFTDEARAVLAHKNSLRLLSLPDMARPVAGMDIKRIAGGILFQAWDERPVDPADYKCVTRREPTADEMKGLVFAWRVAKHVKSNAIVYAHRERTMGIGIGQTSRVYSTRVGAINAVKPLTGTVVASDGFFPFRDSVDAVRRVGVTALIQPGGSVNDEEVILAANEHNMAMIFTGARHFKH